MSMEKDADREQGEWKHAPASPAFGMRREDKPHLMTVDNTSSAQALFRKCASSRCRFQKHNTKVKSAAAFSRLLTASYAQHSRPYQLWPGTKRGKNKTTARIRPFAAQPSNDRDHVCEHERKWQLCRIMNTTRLRLQRISYWRYTDQAPAAVAAAATLGFVTCTSSPNVGSMCKLRRMKTVHVPPGDA